MDNDSVKPRLVGVLNLTPDSFSDGGQYNGVDRALAHAEQLFADGAWLVDVGAESTRPGATALTPEQEWRRLEGILPGLIKRHPNRISLDSYHPETIRRAVEHGLVIINDITGFQNPAMVALAAEVGAQCIVSHLPAHDAKSAHGGQLGDDINEVVNWLEQAHKRLTAAGVAAEQIILDPGIGFGKTEKLNWQLLEIARYLPGKSVMVGYSRKRFLGENRMTIEANLAAADIAVRSGARYLRVHDVRSHAQHLQPGVK